MSKKRKSTDKSEPNNEVVQKVEALKIEEEQNPADTRTVTITLESYQNIIGFFPTADIKTNCKYLDVELGETSNIPITDGEDLTINESFTFQINANSIQETDHLISMPAILTVSQQAGTCDQNLYEQLKRVEDISTLPSAKSFDSVVSIYEAFTGDILEREVPAKGPKKGKSKGGKSDKKKKDAKGKEKGSKGSKVSKASMTSKKEQKEKAGVPPVNKETGPIVFGMCTIDFLPLFHGKKSFSETLTINPVDIVNNEHMATYKNRPKIVITICIDKELELKDAVIMNFTVESIYNLPSIMHSEMDYKICAMLPMENSPKQPILFTNPRFVNTTEEDVMKCWPGLRRIGVNANTTKYKISDDGVKNTVGCDINIYVKDTGSPRIEFNTLKRNLLLKEGMNTLSFQIQVYRKFVLEIYMTTMTKEKTSSINTTQPHPSKEKGKAGSHEISDSYSSRGRSIDSTTKTLKSQPFLHLMTILDVSSLLFPGVSKLRIASPLTTYNSEEAKKFAGLNESYFVPKIAMPDASTKESTPKKDKKEKKGKDKKSGKGSQKGAKDLKDNLPPKPQPPPPSEITIPVFSEDGRPCFIIIEIELTQPIYEKRDVEDLNQQLHDLFQNRPPNPSKIILTRCITKEHYKEALNQITQDMYQKYHQFLETKDSLKEQSFIQYLKNIGAYETYLTSIKKSSALLITNKFNYEESAEKNSKAYQNFIGEIFVYLVSVMNDTLNKLVTSGLKPVIGKKPTPLEKIFYYGKEAVQLGKLALADRYFLERLFNDDQSNCDYWFDYAVYNLEIHSSDKAFECVQEALSKKPTHRYSLMVFGALLADKGQKDDAETCFLNLMVQEPRWLEGWGVLYLFYQKYDKYEGMDVALDMAKKYIDDDRVTMDYFTEFEDLAWTYKICPKTIFFRTATLLLKMRLYNWVEMALAQEIQKHYGLVHYLLSTSSLYQGLYDHALEHITETKASYGADYAVFGLSGHCLLALNKQEEAKEEYLHVIESYNRPDDIHMVYVNCAQILEDLGNDQEARKLILLACKYSPTPYTWFRAGQLYLQENDLLSAEECFSEANFKDNRNPDTWGYLSLINLRLNRPNEAELCYSQALKNKLENPELLDAIQQHLKKFMCP